LFLWITDPMLPQGLEVMEAWGFRYSTVAFTWAKVSRSSEATWAPKWHMGLGYWTRSNPETCLLGVRGSPKRLAKDVRQLITAPVREHSRKPEDAYTGIERLCDGPRLELFGRQSRPGWEVRGAEATKFDDAPQSPTNGAGEAVHAPAVSDPGPDAVSLLSKLRKTTGRVSGIPRLTAEAIDE
jgi:N6-adenosine-specific RNA methylase IME4